MSDEFNPNISSKSATEFRAILIDSLLGTVGVMWIVGGILAVVNLYAVHWALGWLSGFVWVWGCWAAALYFDVKRFFS